MTTPLSAGGHLVECKNCHERTVVLDGTNIHDALNCGCCGSDHKHADEQGMTQNPCRGVIVLANAVAIPIFGG